MSKSSEDTGDQYVEMEWTLPPTAFAPPVHRHPSQVETYEVLEGGLEVMIDGDWRTLAPGDSASVPVKTDHAFRIPSGQSVRVRNFHPPGGRFDQFIEKQHRFATSDRFKGLKRPFTRSSWRWCGRSTPTCSLQAVAPSAGRLRASVTSVGCWATARFETRQPTMGATSATRAR